MRLLHLSRNAITWLFVAALSIALFSALASAYQHSSKVTERVSADVMTSIGQIVIQRTGNMLRTTETQLRTDAVMTTPVVRVIVKSGV